MCELMAVSGGKTICLNDYLKTFFSHSSRHPNGWGLAVFYNKEVSIEKEPVTASKSLYLKERLKAPFEAVNMMAHIRLATRGNMEYENCHPFVRRDCAGRNWTLIHNGTIFDCPVLNRYVFTQQGQTDSERILMYIVDCINEAAQAKGRQLSDQERFHTVDQVLCEITAHNKVNLILYDGSLLYVHDNYRNSLSRKKVGTSMIFSTVPLDRDNWEYIPLNTLEAYKNGRRKFTGTDHGNEYIDDPEDMRLIYLDYAGL